MRINISVCAIYLHTLSNLANIVPSQSHKWQDNARRGIELDFAMLIILQAGQGDSEEVQADELGRGANRRAEGGGDTAGMY